MSRYAGKVAIVTGASNGIGRATAMAFAREGAAVAVADVDTERGQHVVEEITQQGGNAVFVATDVADDGQVKALVAHTVKEFGGLDLAFNNAGIEGSPGPTHECSIENWARTIAINLTGVWSCMRHEIPRLLERGGGAIVNCASIAGLVGFPNVPAYTASKHGVIGLTRTAALDYATQGIRINAVCPGVIATEMIERFTHGDSAAGEQLILSEPVGRMGTADEIADAVLWLCSAQSSFVTGHALAVDGGFVAR